MFGCVKFVIGFMENYGDAEFTVWILKNQELFIVGFVGLDYEELRSGYNV